MFILFSFQILISHYSTSGGELTGMNAALSTLLQEEATVV